MYRDKPAVFEAVTVHKDDIGQLPAGALVLAASDMGLQAVELRHGAAVFWGVQYHPEYSYAEIAATALRYGEVLVREQLFTDRAALDGFVAELRTLQARPQDRALNWKHGLGPAMQDPRLKLAELRNWLELQVLERFRQRR
jgi:GMP synthase (glutamine-hydrolysing)